MGELILLILLFFVLSATSGIWGPIAVVALVVYLVPESILQTLFGTISGIPTLVGIAGLTMGLIRKPVDWELVIGGLAMTGFFGTLTLLVLM